MSHIVKASSLPKTPTLLIYGDNRCGKTHLLSTASLVKGLQPTLIIDADNGAITAQHVNADQDIFVFDSTKQYLTQLQPALKEAKEGKYKFIGVDTLSYLMHRCLMEMSAWQKPSFNHYSALFAVMHRWIIDLKNITPYVCCTCFVKHDKNDDGVIESTFPMIVGQDFPRQVASEFNILGFLSADNGKKTSPGKEVEQVFTLKTRQAGKEKVGDRLAIVGDIINPTMQKLFEAIGFEL